MGIGIKIDADVFVFMVVSVNCGSFQRGVGLLKSRFRVDPADSYMAASIKRGAFLWCPCNEGRFNLGV